MSAVLQRLVLVFALCAVSTATAIPLDSIVVQNTKPIAPRGGVLMVRLLSEHGGGDWPSSIPVVFADGSAGEGVVGWIEPKFSSTSWADESVSIRPVLSTDTMDTTNPLDTVTGPVLLLPLPPNGEGSIRLGATSFTPRWMNLPSELPNLNIDQSKNSEQLSISVADHLPPTGALHYWRWALLASRIGEIPPDIPSTSEVEMLAAQHGEQVWRIGLNNLSIASRAVAATCRDLLTDTSTDGGHKFACWVENPFTLEELLGTLLDFEITSRQLVLRALRWVDRQPRTLVWFESLFGHTVTLKFANSNPEPALCLIAWSSEDAIPLPLEASAHETGRITLVRPQVLDLSVFGPQTTPPLQELVLKRKTGTTVFPIDVGIVEARPPCVVLPALVPSWTLESIRQGRPRRTKVTHETRVEVRHVMGNWEIFIQCKGYAPDQMEELSIASTGAPVGVEAITLYFASRAQPLVIQPTEQSNMTASTQLTSDGWNARVIVHESMIIGGKLSFSVVRTHGGRKGVETSPMACMPWDMTPSPIVIDTTHWNSIGQIPITPEPQ